MNTFDSAFEALALHYAGFGLFAVVNNVWTIVALVTAALSFWRLRATSLPLPLPPPLPSDRFSASSTAADAIDSTPSSEEASAAIPPIPKVAVTPPACDGDVVTKGRFVTYYYYYREDDRCDATAAATTADEEEEVERRGDRRCGGGKGEWWEGWEKSLRLRTNGVEEGTGWYDYQDRSVLSGSVVRLWEEERRWRRGLVVASPVTSSGRCSVGF